MPVVTLNPFDPVKTVATMLGSELSGCRFGCAGAEGLGAVEAAAASIPGFAADLNDRRKALQNSALSAFRRVKLADAKIANAKRDALRAKTSQAKAEAVTRAAVATAEAQKATSDAVIERARLERMSEAAKVAEKASMLADKRPEEALKLAARAEEALQTPVQVDVPVLRAPSIKSVLTQNAPNVAPQVTMALVGSKEVKEMQEDLFAATVSPDYLAARAAAWEEVKEIVSAKNPFNQGWNFTDDTEWAQSGLLAGLGDFAATALTRSASAAGATRKAIGLGDLGLDFSVCGVLKASGAIGDSVCSRVKGNTVVGKQCVQCGFKVADSAPAAPDPLPANPPAEPPASNEYDTSLPWCDDVVKQIVASMNTQQKQVQSAWSAWRPTHLDCPLCGEKAAGKNVSYTGNYADGSFDAKGTSDGLPCISSWQSALKAAGVASDAVSGTCPGSQIEFAAGGKMPKCNARGSGQVTTPGGGGGQPGTPSGGLPTGLVVGGLAALAIAGYFVTR